MAEQGEPKAGGGGFLADWRNVAIAVLVVLLVGVGLLALTRGGLGGGGESAREVVEVFDVVVDRDARQFVDILFDQPIGEGKVGEVLGEAPATIDPPLAGHWRWLAVNALRFEPSGGFPIASQYAVTLIPERLLGEGQTLGGDHRLVVRTDQFLVESVEVTEEPLLDGEGRVLLRGTIRFNYAVDPETLAPLIRLEDAEAEGGKVEVTLEESYWTRPEIGFRTGPVQKKAQERQLELVVDAALTPGEGNVPLGQDFVQKLFVGSKDKLSVREVRSFPGEEESRLEVVFSSPITTAAARPYVSVEPAVDFRLSASRNRLSLTGAFLPGASYHLKLGAGLPAADQAVLPEASETDVRLADLEASADFQSQGLFLSAQGPRAIAIETVNVQKVQISVDRVYRNNLFTLIEYGGALSTDATYSGDVLARALGDRLTTKTLGIDGQRNRSVTTVVSLAEMVPAGEPGLYRVLLSRPGDWRAEQRWILITELGAVAKQGQGDFMVWAASSRTLEPAAGAKVTLISDQNQVLGEGRTDASGLWRLGDAEVLKNARPFLVTVEKGRDFSFLFLDRMAIDTTGLDVAGAQPQGKGYTAFLYGERDLYRPGETLKGVAMVRAGDLSTPPAMPAILRHRDPQGRVLSTQRLQLDRRGMAELSLDLPPYALTGTHSLELEAAEKILGTYRFQVEEFVPDRIQVGIEPATEEVVPGQELAYTVKSSYLFGPPAAGLAMESRVRLVSAPFAPESFAEYTFGDSDRSFEDREIFHQQGTLDADGRAQLKSPVLAVSEVPAALMGIVTARVQEAGGRGVTATKRVPIHPVPYYLGLKRRGEGYPEPGQDVSFDFVAVSPEGKEKESGELVAELYLERWNTVLRKTPAGTFRYESTRESVPVQQQSVAGGSKRGTVKFRPEEYGRHRLVLSDPATGAATSIGFYVSGWGYSPWAIENPSRVELDLDREEYRPGDVATVQVRAPFPGTLLLTVEADRVLETQIHSMSGNTATVQVPIKGAYRPNAYVTATLVRSSADLEPGGVARAFGAVALPVDRVTNRLPTELEVAEEVRSQTEVEIVVDTAPGAAVTVAAVDEGILQLIAQKSPDPFEFFYRRLALGVTSYDSFGLLLPDVEGAPAAGGGAFEEDEAQYVRTDGIRRAKPAAFWSGVLTADGAGKARTKIQLPEFQGALRVMAVTADGRRFGAASERLRVRDPIVLLPTLPRVLSYGERLRIPVTVRNDTGAAGPVEVRVAVTGSGKVAGEAKRSVEIADGAEATVYFDVETADTGDEIELRIVATGHGETARTTGWVPLRPDLPAVATRRSGSLDAASTEFALEAGSLRPGTAERRLRIGNTPLVQFSGRLRSLLTYPYGCLEQTVSRAFPLIYLGDLAQELEPDLLDSEQGAVDPEARVLDALRRVSRLQLPSGGFALWPGESQPEPWASIYTTHFLVEAQQAGYPVDSLLLERALVYQSGQVRSKATYGSDELERLVYSLYTLARAGRGDLGTMDFIRSKHAASLSSDSRALLAAAYAAVGDSGAVDELLASLGEVERVERQTGGNFDSTVRRRALTLLAMLDAAPESPRLLGLVERLARDTATAGEWTTQESGFALLALGRFFHRQVERPPVSGRVLLGKKVLGSFDSRSPAVFSGIEGTEPLTIELAKGNEAGSAYFSLTTRGIPTDAAFAPESAGLEIERQLSTRDGGALTGALQQGDLVVLRMRVRSTVGPLENVVVEALLPSGLEIENPRLETTETLGSGIGALDAARHADLRDDRVLLFVDLPASSWKTYGVVLRAVTPGQFRLPPLHAEAMYDPAIQATGERGSLEVTVGK